MRHLCLVAAIASLAFLPPIAASASWQLATATSAEAGIKSHSTFVVQAYVTLPNSCYSAGIQQVLETPQFHRHFRVVQQAPTTICSGPQYKCTVVSPTYNLPVQQPFEVDSKGQTWKVHLTTQPPTPVPPICRKG
jgi:hypothetical protein